MENREKDHQLTNEDLSMLITSMEYTIRAFENYEYYPSFEFKLARIKEAKDLLDKIRDMKRTSKTGANNE